MKLQGKPCLLICDVFKVQWTDVVKYVKKSNRKMVPVPNNWTNYFLPLDMTVNESSKSFLRQEVQSWYLQVIVKQMEAGKRSDEIKVDVRVSVVKPLQAKWIVKFYDYVKVKPQFVKNAWKE